MQVVTRESLMTLVKQYGLNNYQNYSFTYLLTVIY